MPAGRALPDLLVLLEQVLCAILATTDVHARFEDYIPIFRHANNAPRRIIATQQLFALLTVHARLRDSDSERLRQIKYFPVLDDRSHYWLQVHVATSLFWLEL